MPAVDLCLSDAEIADLVTFIRSACGKQVASVESNRATRLRRKLRAEPDPAGPR
ncbi:hypothetical protein SAMN05216345_12214 [Cupriavidus sp. YR651]|nr:hypothetical protein SAMN05216345_12214 [Cupriavidus sp. YR651]